MVDVEVDEIPDVGSMDAVIEAMHDWCEKNEGNVVFLGSFISIEKGSDTENGLNIAFGPKECVELNLRDLTERLKKCKDDFVNW